MSNSNNPPKVLCLYVCLPDEITCGTLQSILNQTVPVTELLVITEKSYKKDVARRVSEVVNRALVKVSLEEYDYILRVDSYVILPENYLELNLAIEPDIMGYGTTQIIKVKPFLKLMNGRFHPDQDDTYIRDKFAVAGYRVCAPLVKSKSGRPIGATHGLLNYQFMRGESLYRIGYTPLHIIFGLTPTVEDLVRAIGYFKTLFMLKKRFDCSNVRLYNQLQTLKNPRKMLSRIRGKAVSGFAPGWVKGPLILQLDGHTFCNEHCVCCNVPYLCAGKYGFMDLAIARQAIRETAGTVRQIKLFLNGDPLFVHPKDPLGKMRLPTLAKIAKEENPQAITTIFTNGAACENKELLRDKNIDDIHFTISADTAETYKIVHGKDYFDRALTTVQWISKNKLPHQKITIRFVTLNQNYHEIPGWKKRFARFTQVVAPLHCGYEQKSSEKLVGAETETLNLQEWKQEYPSDLPCNCWNNLAISWDGRIIQCCDGPYKANYGKVGETPLMTAWKRKLENKMDNPVCQPCNLKHPFWKHILDTHVKPSYYAESVDYNSFLKQIEGQRAGAKVP